MLNNLWTAYEYMRNDQTKTMAFRESALSLAVNGCAYLAKRKPSHIVRYCYGHIKQKARRRVKALNKIGLIPEFSVI